MQTLTPIEWKVLRLTAVEPENLEQIYDQLRNPPWKTPLAETADAVRSLVEKGILSPRAEDAEQLDDVSRIWKATFEPTAEGKQAISEETLENPTRKSYFGVFQDRGIHVTREDIDESRREMWKNPPKDVDPSRDSQQTPPAKRRSLLGIFAGRLPDIPFEVFKENRREMSRKYAEDSSDE